ncbi:MAG TPA: type 1 glutamine amidotransferase domain-containing protein [Actinomycetota bacterium]|nr:type 1 glutamine amidotransferase domain-containing protein [Actinomycetota bacterium]
MAKVAFIMDEMFEDSEFRVPFERVKEAGHEPVVIGLKAGKDLAGKKGKVRVTTDAAISDVDPSEFDALVIPGGYSPDKIRVEPKMAEFTRQFDAEGKPIAAICHAGWMLAEANLIKGRTVTSWPSIKTDLINAGANWVDQEVVEDGNIITSRKPDDLEAFTKTLLAQIEQRT